MKLPKWVLHYKDQLQEPVEGYYISERCILYKATIWRWKRDSSNKSGWIGGIVSFRDGNKKLHYKCTSGGFSNDAKLHAYWSNGHFYLDRPDNNQYKTECKEVV